MYLRSEFWDANAKKERKRKREEKKEWRGKEEKGGEGAPRVETRLVAYRGVLKLPIIKSIRLLKRRLQFTRPVSEAQINLQKPSGVAPSLPSDRQPPMRNARTSVDKQQQMTFLANYFHPLPSFLVPSLLFQSADGELRIYRNSFYFGKLSKHENIFFFCTIKSKPRFWSLESTLCNDPSKYASRFLFSTFLSNFEY